jgi:cytochrome c-type biogenesis protein
MGELSDFLHNLALNSSIPLFTALLLGMMSALGPCTMTANIAAVAYISRRLDDRKYAVISSVSYTFGRVTAQAILGLAILGIGLEVNAIRNFLEGVGAYIIGPFLVIGGLLMLFADRMSFGGGGRLAALSEKAAGWGVPGAFVMGFLFALAFCPYTAVLFFAVMIPLALTVKDGVLLLPAFALGSGLPVIIVGIFLSAGVTAVSIWVKNLARAQKYISIAMALIFISVGIYYLVNAF